MDAYHGYSNDGSDNEDLVADLLAKFNSSATTQVQEQRLIPQPLAGLHHHVPHSQIPAESQLVFESQPQSLDQSESFSPLPLSAPPQRPSPPHEVPREIQLAAVEIPTVENTEEYEFLPGHFAVRYIISEISHPENEPSYRVRLRSGELETITFSRLQSIENGPVALLRFQNSEKDGYASDMDGVSTDSDSSPSMSHMSFRLPDEEGASVESGVRGRRSRRAKNTRFTDFFGPLSSDEEPKSADEAASSSEDIIASSAITSRTRRLRRRGQERQSRRARLSSSESEYAEPRGTRFSTRKRNVIRKNLRERLEDDISEHEGSSKEKKFFGAKEVFHKIPADDAFRLRHHDTCEVCQKEGDDYFRGPLVFCQGCTSAYHQICLGPRSNRDHLVTKVADDQFILQCRRCLGLAHVKDPVSPHQGCCTECTEQGKMSKPLRERLTPKQEQQIRQENGGKDPITPVDMATVNNVDNVLFRCTVCRRAFHFAHLPPISDTTDDPATARFEDYTLYWKCHDCSSVPGEIGALVAWRPTDLRPGYAANAIKEADKEYLIKWKGYSYHHTSWMPGSWVWGIVNPHMRRTFFKSERNLKPYMSTEEAIPEDFLRVDIVFQVYYSDEVEERSLEIDLERIDKVTRAYVKYKGLPYEDAEWDSPPDPSQTERWTDFKAAYEDWVRRDYIHTPDAVSLGKHLDHIRKQNFKTKVVRDTQPETLTGGELMAYQKDGVNWLYYMWFKQQNAILADEMGLGKTIQIIGFFATLIQYHKCWPFLVVVPNSTCPNWRKEIKTWAPSIRVVTYYGSSFARKLAQEHEMFSQDEPDLRCHVVVTSYETMIDDASRRVLLKIPWAGLVVDEGQRLKNDKSQIYESLLRFKFPFKVLLTGTPLQNNTRELFNLLQFCDPTKNAEELDEEYGTLSKENIPELHSLIRPFFLRRTKAQVLTFLPPMVQIIVPVSMSIVQKKLYKSILAKNPQLIKAIFQRNANNPQGIKQADRHNLNNILMQLRKCLCHPFVYSEAIEERTANADASFRNLVEAAGKLQLLEIMLPKLKERGHRVLIFSQFLGNLDIVEDFLDGLGFLHRRLDGRMSSLEKQKRIDEYNAEDSPYFAFLLSTRSGGVGINLATADTVIIMDPDFNPHQDMQALSRAHRIGQKNKVLVFQLMTRGSVEEKIMQIGKKKMVLDHVLIDRMVSEEDDGRDLESILRHGAQALFEDDDSGDVHYDSESVDKLLDRSQAEQAKTPDENNPESQFSFARVWANDHQNLDGHLPDTEDEDPAANNTVWEKILQEREQAAAEEARKRAETLGRGKRKRTTVDYGKDVPETSPVKMKMRREAESDGEYKVDDAIESESDHDPGMDSDEMERLARKSKVRPFKRIIADEVPAYGEASMDGIVETRRTACFVCNKPHPLGACRLKVAGVEHCGLCGLAHFGIARTCPHLRSEMQVARMLETLRQSTENRELIEKAKKYLQGIRGDLSQRRRNRLSSNQAPVAATPLPVSAGSPVIDLTGSHAPLEPSHRPGYSTGR